MTEIRKNKKSSAYKKSAAFLKEQSLRLTYLITLIAAFYVATLNQESFVGDQALLNLFS